LAACSGSSGSSSAGGDAAEGGSDITSTTIDGTFAGQRVPTDASIGLYGVGTTAGTYAGAIITNVTSACALFMSATNPATSGPDVPNTVQLNLKVQPLTAAGNAVPIPPGTYSITGNTDYTVNAGLEATDSACMNLSITADASSGSIELVTVSASAIAGRFDLTFPSGDHLTGQFYAPVCSFDLNAFSQHGLHGCGSADAGPE
jgi:hypothetical protein